jgi:hypothetical protein
VRHCFDASKEEARKRPPGPSLDRQGEQYSAADRLPNSLSSKLKNDAREFIRTDSAAQGLPQGTSYEQHKLYRAARDEQRGMKWRLNKVKFYLVQPHGVDTKNPTAKIPNFQCTK